MSQSQSVLRGRSGVNPSTFSQACALWLPWILLLQAHVRRRFKVGIRMIPESLEKLHHV